MTTDEEFIAYCYNKVLGRGPDESGLAHYLEEMSYGISRERILLNFLDSEEFNNRLTAKQKFVPDGHFYSPIPEIESIDKLFERVSTTATGIELNDEKQIKLFEAFKPYISVMPFSCGTKNNYRYFFNGELWYGYGDATILFSMINYFKPKRYIEIGSGYSSIVALDSCEFANLETQITFIEPYPALLRSLLSNTDDAKKLIIKSKVEALDISIFESLEKNDILFIDSSHVVKFGSDVLYLITEVLPRLKPGVIIHFHDIFWPFEYPIEWLKEGRAWNEIYVLKSMLSNNNNYEIIYFNDYMGKTHPELLKEKMPSTESNNGCGLWLRKIL